MQIIEKVLSVIRNLKADNEKGPERNKKAWYPGLSVNSAFHVIEPCSAGCQI